MPLEHPAMMLMVPVGAMVVVVALRMRPLAVAVILAAGVGGEVAPVYRPGGRRPAATSSRMKAMTCSATATASSEL